MEADLQYRGLTNRGSLAFGYAVFTTTPSLYEMTPEEAETILSLCGDRVILEPLEARTCVGEAKDHAHREDVRAWPGATRSTAAAGTD